MISVFFSILVSLLAIAGLCELIYTIKLFLLSPSKKPLSFIIIYLKKNIALEQLTYIFEKLKWNGESYATQIVAITDNIYDSECLLCNEFAIEHNIVLSKFEDIEITLKEICSYNQGHL